MTKLHEIRQRIEALRTEARGINEKAGDGALDAAAESRFTEIESQVKSLQAAERRAEFIDQADRSAPGESVTGDRRFDELRSGVSLSAVIRSQLRDHRDTHEAGRVREISAELARRSGRTPTNGGLLFDMRGGGEERALQTGKQGSSSNGAALVPLIQRPQDFVDVLRQNLVVERAGARVITDLHGDVAIPKKVQTTQPAFVNEGQPLPLSDIATAQLKMTPKTAGCVSQLSRHMILQSSPSAEALVADDQAKQLAQLIDQAALLGDGTGAMPLGVIPQATARSWAHGGNPTYADILGAMDVLEALNIQPSAWIVGAGVRSRLAQTPRSASASEGFVLQSRGSLIDTAVLQTGNVPAGSLLLGDFSELVIGWWSQIEVSVNDQAESAFMRGDVLVRIIATLDVLCRRPAAFVKLAEGA